MTKDIIKELIIVLLLALAIILFLSILLYEYIPSNKIVPEKISYITPEEVTNELVSDEDIIDDIEPPSYSIDSTDLTNYKKTQDYVPGKKNPFASLSEEVANETTENNGTNTSTGTQQNNSTTTDNNSTGYLPDKGTK